MYVIRHSLPTCQTLRLATFIVFSSFPTTGQSFSPLWASMRFSNILNILNILSRSPFANQPSFIMREGALVRSFPMILMLGISSASSEFNSQDTISAFLTDSKHEPPSRIGSTGGRMNSWRVEADHLVYPLRAINARKR